MQVKPFTRYLLLFAFALTLGSTASAQKNSVLDLPADYFTRDVKPLNVTPAVDADNSDSDIIGPGGGQLTTLDATGNTYTLTVPKGALGFPERLTMTPLTVLKGMPFKGGVNAGVQLEPEGTFFVQPVTLEVEFAQKPDLKAITPFNYTGAGQDFTTTMLMHDPGHYVFLLNHFSGAGFASSTVAEQTAEAVRQPLADEERIQHVVQQELGEERQRQLMGQDSDPTITAAVIAKATAEYEKEVIQPLKEASTKSCAAGTLYIQKLLGLERQKQLLGAGDDQGMSGLANALGGPILKRCLEEEAQACYKNGDILRFATWYLGVERQRQLLGAAAGDSDLDATFNKAYNACAHFEVQFNATLTQKSDADTTTDTGGVIAAKGKGTYNATITSILPIKSNASGGALGILAGSGVPHGDQPLPYATYAMSFTVNGGIAVAQTNSGTVGVASNCAESGTGTTPGQLTVYFLPAFVYVPPDPNAPDPALQGLTPLQKRILLHTPRVGLLAPPRKLDLVNTLLDIAVGTPTEHTQSSCDKQNHDLTTWLDGWNEQLKKIGNAVTVTLARLSPFGGADTSKGPPGFELKKWQKTETFPIKVVQDTSKSEAAGSGTYTETWHLDITVVHTPKEGQ